MKRILWELYADILKNCPKCTTDLVRVANCSMAPVKSLEKFGLIYSKWERLKDRDRTEYKVWYPTDQGKRFVELVEEVRIILKR